MKYETKPEKIVVLLDLPGGGGDCDWQFNEYGDAIIITVNWSKAVYGAIYLFQAHLRENMVTINRSVSPT